MKRTEPHHDPHEARQQFIGLRGSLFICAALASLCFWLRYALEDIGYPILGEVSLHLGIAFVVAGTIIGVVEIRAHKIGMRETLRFRDEVSRDVFQALLGRITPPEVFHEINDILHENIVRRGCKYRIIFKKPYPDMPRGYFVIRREVTYRVENLLSRKTTFVARSSHSEDLDLAAAGWTNHTFHLKLMIGDRDVELKKGFNLFVEDNFTRLSHEITLGPRESKEITLHGEEPSLVSAARNSYLQATPVIGIEVELWNEYPEAIGSPEVHMNHPAAAEARPNGIGRYVLDRAFLPGQGFQVVWKHREVPSLDQSKREANK